MIIINSFPILTIHPTPFNTITLGVENKILEIDKAGEIINTDSVIGKIYNHWVDREGTIWIKCVSNKSNLLLENYFFVKRKNDKIKPFFDAVDSQFKVLDNQHVRFSEDNEGRIWGGYSMGLILFEKSGKLIYDLPNDLGEPGQKKWVRLHCFADDLIWFSTFESEKQGVFSLSIKKNNFQKHLSNQSPTYSLRGLLGFEDSLLKINSYLGDLILNINTKEVHKVKNLNKNINIRTGFGLTKDASGVIYSGEHGDLINTYNPKNKIKDDYFFRSEIGEFFIPFIDKYQTCWIGGTSGLGYLNPEKDSLIVFDQYNGFPNLKGKEIFHFYESEEGVWIGTSNGLYLLDPQKGIIDHKNDFLSLMISYIYKDSDGVFWLGTTDKGVIKWNREQDTIRNFTKEDCLTDNTIHAIFEDDFGALWMSSNYGLMRFDKASGKINSFFEKDGLAGNEFNRASYYQHEDGTIYFGGVNGLTVFHPRDFDFQKRGEKTKPVVTKFEKLDIESGKLIDQTQAFFKENKINLTAGDKSFIVNFANLDFSHLAKKRHAYKIEGLDESWVPLNENYVRVNQLPYGDYYLKIKSIGRRGAWSDVLSVPVIVAKPFYLKTGFIILSTLGVLLLVGGFIRYRTYHLRKRADALTIEVFKRTKIIEEQKNELEKSNKVKEQFLRLIGHDLKTPLISLSGMSQKLNFLIQQKRYDDIIKLSASIDKSSSNISMLLDNLMNWALMQKDHIHMDPQVLAISDLVEEVTVLYSEIADVKKVKFDICNLEGHQVYADRNAMLTILRNLFDNAIKYSPNDSVVKLNVADLADRKSIKIENFGQGINEEVIRNIINNNPVTNKSMSGLGLLICKELTELNKGVFSIFNEENIKTIANLELPRSLEASSVEINNLN